MLSWLPIPGRSDAWTPRRAQGKTCILIEAVADVDSSNTGGEALPDLSAWINNSNTPDLPWIIADTHRTSSREDWLKFLGTGLLEAASDGNLEAVKQLLVGGAPLHARDSEMLTPLHRASASGHGRVVDFLLLSSDGNAPLAGATNPSWEHHHRPRMAWQASIEGPALVPSLSLRKKSIVDARDSNGSTPLHFAAERGHTHVVELLLKHGTDISCRNGINKQTPLHYAAAGSSNESIHLLLAAGGNVMARDNAGRTPLHVAASSGSPGMVSTLVEGGADLEARGSISNRTPLHEACASLRPDVVRRLIDLGADECAVDSDDLTARAMVGDWVTEEERIEIRITEMVESIHCILVGAPKQRLWRRRRLLPLLRWRSPPTPSHAGPGATPDGGGFNRSLAEFLIDLDEGLVRNIVCYL